MRIGVSPTGLALICMSGKIFEFGRPDVMSQKLGLTIFHALLPAVMVGGALADETIKGQVLAGRAPIVRSTVTLWEASAAAPKRLAQAKTDGDGRFDIRGKSAGKDSILYLIASGGEPKAKQDGGENPAIALLCLLGNKLPDKVVINEFTTVASAFTAARFIDGTSISGNPLGLRVAAMNVPNFVNLETGSWGKTIMGPFNSYRSTTLAKFDTLATLITYTATSASSDWRTRFFSAATPDGGKTPSNTLEAGSDSGDASLDFLVHHTCLHQSEALRSQHSMGQFA